MSSRRDAGRGFLAFLAVAGPFAILAWSFSSGFELGDEGMYVYLLEHPRAAMTFMDHFLWGHVLSMFPWTVEGARWVALAALLVSNTALLGAVHAWLRCHAIGSDPSRVSRTTVVLALLGMLMFYSIGRPTLGYNVTMSIAPTLFVAAMLGLDVVRSRAGRVLALAALSGANALAFAGRMPIALFLPMLFFLWHGRLTPGSVTRGTALRRTAIVVMLTVLLIGAASAGGYDLPEHWRLIRAAADSNHSVGGIIRHDVVVGLKLTIAGGCIALALSLARLRWLNGLRVGWVIVGAVALGVAAVTGSLVASGNLVSLPARGDPALMNPEGPVPVLAINLAALVLAGLFAWPTTRLVWIVALLCATCLAASAGSNMGVWAKSLKNMGPLWLACGLLLDAGVARGWLRPWMRGAVVGFAALLVAACLYQNSIARPYRLDGGAFAQTVILDRPASLRGLRVSPSVATMQRDLEEQLRAARFDRDRERMLPRRAGMAVLADARIIGPPWYEPGSAEGRDWNCAALARDLTQRPRRIIAVDIESLTTAAFPCLADYEVGPPLSSKPSGVVRVLTRRQER